MPRRSSLKTLLIESMLFVSSFALVAHLSINFWERYALQTDLTHMKYSLHSMKETINKIGNAYDILQRDLKGLIKAAENTISMETSRKPEHDSKRQYSLDRRTLHNIKVQAKNKVKLAKDEKVGTSQSNLKEVPYDINANPDTSNATTITKYPLKSTGMCSNSNKEETCCDHTCAKKHKCYKVYNYCRDPRAIFEN